MRLNCHHFKVCMNLRGIGLQYVSMALFVTLLYVLLIIFFCVFCLFLILFISFGFSLFIFLLCLIILAGGMAFFLEY